MGSSILRRPGLRRVARRYTALHAPRASLLPSLMIAVAAHPDPQVLDQLAAILEDAGWTVHGTQDPDAALAACRRVEADVLMVGQGVRGGAPELLDRIKRDGDLFRTAVVLLGEQLEVENVLEW